MNAGLATLQKLSQLPIFAFKPTVPQEPFVNTTSRRVLVRAANRVGKSFSCAYKVSRYALKNPGSRIRVVGVNYKTTNEILGRYLNLFLSPWMVPDCHYSLRGFPHNQITLKNGTVIQFKSADQLPIAHAGESLDLVWLDEPPPQAIYVENLNRLTDRQGTMILTATMIGREVTWLKDLVEGEDSNFEEFVVPFCTESVPWLTPEQVEEVIEEAKLDPLSFEQRINGGWSGTTPDRLFSAFSASNLFDEIEVDVDKITISIDHGEIGGHQIALLLAHTKKQIFVIDEVVNTTYTTVEDDARAIDKMLRENGVRWQEVSEITGDSNSAGKLGSGRSVNQILTTCIAEILGISEHRLPSGLVVKRPNNKTKGSVRLGERLINAGFHKQELLVSNKCKTLINSLKHYTGQEELKHPVDALRYGTAHIFQEKYKNGVASHLYVDRASS